MRVCRFVHQGRLQVGLYDEGGILPLPDLAAAHAARTHDPVAAALDSVAVLDYLPPDGRLFGAASRLWAWARRASGLARLPVDAVELLAPIPNPGKLLLVSSNFDALIAEGGGAAVSRGESYPYLFSKPPGTTVTDPGKPVILPKVSPDHVDWEVELCVVVGRRARHVTEVEALDYVAGYTVGNDISDRRFRPNARRRDRPNDPFFDWLHGKWHDTFFPCGPCVASARELPDPQALAMRLSVNGQVKQDASTAQQIFPVAAVIAFASDLTTLEPGDLISTGSPGGIGFASGTYLKPGDRMEAWIEGIGTLLSPVVGET